MEVVNITKAATFKKFSSPVLFNIFMRQTLTDDFWGLHKNINCVFPLIRVLKFD